MRNKRVKKTEEISYYHCICRCVGLLEFLEPARVKNVLQEMLWRAADFSGVQVITYCIMDDHFHLLVRVPPRNADITEEELLRRYRSLYYNTPLKLLEFTRMLKERGIRRDLAVAPDPQIEELITRLKTRMHDVSEFMKTLKQRFTQWYNKNNERVGTLWTERFKSLIVENNQHLLAAIAAYIEMNPVRAGICKKAQDHQWCGIRDFLDRNGIYSTLQVPDTNTRYDPRLDSQSLSVENNLPQGEASLRERQSSQSFSVENNLPQGEASLRERQSYGYEFYRYEIMPLVEEAQTEFTEEKQKALESARKAINTNRKEALAALNLPMKSLLMGKLRHLAEGVAIGSILFLQILASSANGVSRGSVPIRTGLQVDEDLKLMCLRRIRGPKIE